MTQDEQILVRQVELWARFNQEACQFEARGNRGVGRRHDRPFFVIDVALHGCGYTPCVVEADMQKWDVIKAWMYEEGYAGTRRRGEHYCEDPSCAERG